jgi:hypothetical protein
MVVLLHGDLGGWDELAIALAAIVVLWVAVKLAGRKSAGDEDDEDLAADELAAADQEERQDPAHSSPTRLG